MEPFSVLPNLKADLDRVEKKLELEIYSEVDFVTQVANHLIPAGGKRIRPGFAITAACLENTGTVSDDVISAAASVELVHLGSLYHDDVMDGAEKRRNVDSVNIRYGDHTAILAGDFLLARASLLAASLGSKISELLAETIASLCEGQIQEHRDIHNVLRMPESYMTAIRGKTASLLSLACEIGAVVAGSETSGLISEFGITYGMAFQISDDISDLLIDDSDDKPRGNDVKEGNYTLPVIYALQESKDKEQLRDILGEKLKATEGFPEKNWQQVLKAIEIVVASEGPAMAEAEARKFIAASRKILEQLPKCEAKQVFELALESLN